jgi:epimerase transport system membrane fusion protein
MRVAYPPYDLKDLGIVFKVLKEGVMFKWLQSMQILLAKGDDVPFRRLGLWVIFWVFGVFGAWAAFAPLNSAALAPGSIAVESYRKSVQHLEGGIIASISVRDGDKVSKGQVLVELDDTQSRAQLEVLRGQYFIDVARESRLIAQEKLAAKIDYPADLLNATDDRVRDAIRVQDQTYFVRRTAHENEVSVYQRQVEQLKAKIQGLHAQKASHQSLVNSFQRELNDFEILLKDGYTEKQKVRELERSLSDHQGQLGALQSEIAATSLQISETELKVLQLEKELQREVTKELGEVQSQLFELREKIQSLESTVKRTVVTAPEDGMVLGLSIHTIGAVIPPGGRILDIVPQNEKLIVEAQVSLMDIDQVQVGQVAEIRFSAFKSRETPKVQGKLISISADKIVDEKVPNSQPYYLARVDVDPQGLTELHDKGLDLVPGMPAEVLINTGQRTLLQYLTRPLTDSFSRSFIED